MGEKGKKIRRVVLDTSVLISALLFGGELSRLVVQWQMGVFTPVISKETFEELETVLSYPKFHLSDKEKRLILAEEILPFFEVVEVKEEMKGICRDPADDKFISCALSGGAEVIVTGDSDLLDVKRHKSVRIVSAGDFLKMIE
jgi:putative PIN family toxin of toxin-antitoxin system